MLAAKSRDLLAIDAVHMEITDLAGLGLACSDAMAVGFDTTMAFHPTQVPTIRGVFTVGGQMVDGPIIK